MKPIVLITGGSRGIGAATALAAARAGWAVAVNYHANSLAADEVVRQIRAMDGTAITVQGDVTEGLQGATVTAALLPALKAIEAQWRSAGQGGYRIEVAGAVEESSKGSASIAAGIPIMLFITFTLLMLLDGYTNFNPEPAYVSLLGELLKVVFGAYFVGRTVVQGIEMYGKAKGGGK